MTRAERTFDVGSVLVMGGTLALTASIYPSLPARMPTHFGAAGFANGWMDRDVGAWLVPGLAVPLWAIVRFAKIWTQGQWRARAARSPMAAGAFLTVALMGGVHAMVLWASLHPRESIGRGLGFLLGVFLLVLSLVTPRLRRNPVIGVRTAWTLSSDENWARTHRFASYTFAAGGAVALAAALVGGEGQVGPIALAATMVGALAPAIYSYAIARSEN